MNILPANPVFLFILFAMGYVFGLLLRNPSAGKFIIFGFFGIFIYKPVQEAGLLASTAFVAGILAHHVHVLEMLQGLRFKRRSRARPFVDPQNSERPKRKSPPQDPPQDEPPKQQRSTESEEETHRKYEEYVRQNRQRDAEKAAAEEVKQAASPSERSAEEVLGLSGNYTKEELKAARDRKLQEWHPDKLQTIPERLRKQAEEETKRIITAYKELVRKFK